MDTSISMLRKNLNYVENSCVMSFSNGPLEGAIGKKKSLNITVMVLEISTISLKE